MLSLSCVQSAPAASWVNTGALNAARHSHTATLLLNGKVLVAGGSDGSEALVSAELYDTATGNWASTGDRGWFELAPAYGYGGIQGRRSDGQWTAFPAMDHFATEMDDFAQCILNGRPTKVPGEEGLRDLKIMMAIYEAAQTGKTISLT